MHFAVQILKLGYGPDYQQFIFLSQPVVLDLAFQLNNNVFLV